MEAVQTRFTFDRKFVVFCSVLHFGLSLGLPFSMSVMFLDWQHSFDSPRGRTAAVQSTCFGFAFAGGLIPGYLMSRFGARPTMLLGVAFTVIGLFASAFVPSLELLTFTAGAMAGLGFCLLQVPAIPCAALTFPSKSSLVISFCCLGPALTALLVPYMSRILIQIYSWRGACIIFSGITLNLSLTSLILSSYKSSTSPTLSPSEPTATAIGDHAARSDGEERTVVREGDNEHESGDQSNTKTKEKIRECSGDEQVSFLLLNNGDDTVRHDDADLQLETKEICSKKSLDKEADLLLREDKSLHDFVLSGDDFHKHVEDARDVPTYTSHAVEDGREGRSLRECVYRVQKSRWRFLADPMFYALFLNITLCLTSVACVIMLSMDIAQTKGFRDVEGVHFIMYAFATSICARLTSGAITLIPGVHNYQVICIFFLVGGTQLLILAEVNDYAAVATTIAFCGFALGGIVSGYPKYLLDLHTVDVTSYPIALGLGNMAEGISTFIYPVLIGIAVDATGSYAVPLRILGSLSLAACLLLVVVVYVQRHRGKIQF